MTTCNLCPRDTIMLGSYCQSCIDGIVRRVQLGESMRYIADDLGVSRNAVIGLWNRHKPEGMKSPRAVMKSVETRRKNRVLAAKIEAELLEIPKVTAKSPREPVGCRWIEGDPRDPDWEYCQGKLVRPTSYCAHHLPRTIKTARDVGTYKHQPKSKYWGGHA